MAALDSKNRGFYDSLTDDEKKKFATFLMIRYGSCVSGSADMQAYYLQSTNLKLNRNFFAIPKRHDKLNWLAVTTISPGMGNQFHSWISSKKKESTSKVTKFLQGIYPHAKMDDIALMIELNDAKVWKTLAESMGWTKEQIKKELG